MKILNIPISLMVVMLATLMFSCTDMDQMHEKYVEEGEIIYSKQLDSLYTRSGNNRIELTAIISHAFNVKTIEVSWDKGQKSKVFDYVRQQESDTLSLMIDEIEEGAYEIEIMTKDADENTSIKSSAFASAYGEGYRKYLEPRFIDGFSFDGINGILNLSIAAESDRGTEVVYTNTSASEVTVVVPQDVSSVELPDFSSAGTVKYRTLHVPESTAIDSFPSDWSDFTLPPLMGILESLTVNPVLGGVKVEWKNADQNEINVKVEYIGVDGTTAMVSNFESTDVDGSGVISGMSTSEQTIKVTVSDLLGSSFGPREFTTAPKPAVKIDKSGWTVIDFSSEEPTEANWGPPIQGSAAAAIDDDLSTFWHSSWSTYGQPPYPHHFTVDMGKDVTIASFESFTRENKTGGHKKVKFEVSTDNVNWTDLGEFDVANDTNDGQISAIPSNPIARYFRFTALEGPNYFTYLGEINVYGTD